MTSRASRASTPLDEQAIVASVIVPCYNEGKHIVELTETLFAAINQDKHYNNHTELIFVDDNSKDGTVEHVNELASKGYPVRVIVRTNERGLSSAVLEGFNQAKGAYLVCMDGDMQHPPESVPKLLDVLFVDKKEFVIGSRYATGGDIDKGWPIERRLISIGARILARPLTPLSDPLTGFFGITREAMIRADGARVNKQGFKICLELYCKCKIRSYGEVPFRFRPRKYGVSNLTGGVAKYYLQQLFQLYTSSPKHAIFLVLLFFVAIYLLKLFVKLL